MLLTTAGQTANSSQNKTHFGYRFLVVHDTTVWSFVEQEVHRGAWRQISRTTNQIVPYGLRSRTSQSDCSIRTTKPFKPIRLFHTDYKAVQANQIVPYGLRNRTRQSDCSMRTTKTYKPIRLFLTDYKYVQANQIAPDRLNGHRPDVQRKSSHSHDHI